MAKTQAEKDAEAKAKAEPEAAEAEAKAKAEREAGEAGGERQGDAEGFVNGEPKGTAEDVLGLNGLTEEQLQAKALEVHMAKLNTLSEEDKKAVIIRDAQESREDALISAVKEAFHDTVYPFAGGQKVIVTVFPLNGDYSVQISTATGRKSSKNSAWRITDPEGSEVVATTAAKYCRDRNLDPKGASAVSFLRGKGYKVEEVE